MGLHKIEYWHFYMELAEKISCDCNPFNYLLGAESFLRS